MKNQRVDRRYVGLTVIAVLLITTALVAVLVTHRKHTVKRQVTVIGFLATAQTAKVPFGWPTDAQIRAATKQVPIPLPRPLDEPLKCLRFPNVNLDIVLSDLTEVTYGSCQIPPSLQPVLDALRPVTGWSRASASG
jgi:hypothetical protein